MEVVELSAIPTVEAVDNAMLKRYLELIEKANPDDLTKLMDSWAKYIGARKNSDVFEKQETEAERIDREQAKVFEGVLTGESDTE